MKNFPLWLKFIFIHVLLGFLPFFFITLFLVSKYDIVVRDTADVLRQNGLNAVSIENSLSVLHFNTGFIFGIFVLFFVVGTIVSIHIFTNPLVKLLQWIRSARQKNFSEMADAPIFSTDETGELAGEVNGAIKHFREVGERERAISKAKSEFISIAAHQLRTPLTSIKWSLGLLLSKSTDTKDAAHLLGVSLTSTERMINLVRDLLNANSIEEGKFGLSFRKVDLNPVIDQAVEEVRPIAEMLKVSMRVIKEPGPSEAFIDAEKISLVLSNLLSNALNYTPSGGSVTVRTKQGRDIIEIEIEDTGIGMTPDVQKLIFTKFFRSPEAVRMHPDGSGLGLYIVKNILERHGSSIQIKSKPGEGTTVSFHVPTKENDLIKEMPFDQFFSSF